MCSSDFQRFIAAIPVSESDGKWDYLIRVTRLFDGVTKEDKISGSFTIAEYGCLRLARELGLCDSQVL